MGANMHELQVTQEILNISLQHANRAGAVRINTVQLVIGQLSSIIDDCVAFYWDIISKDTIAEAARLTFERIPARFRCDACGQEFPMHGDDWSCPRCVEGHITLLEGDEFYLKWIDVEMPHNVPEYTQIGLAADKEKL
jgi:hydrogenase nickel incorporation protein HypA/HybF